VGVAATRIGELSLSERSAQALDASLRWTRAFARDAVRLSQPDDPAELEADRVADSVMQSLSARSEPSGETMKADSSGRAEASPERSPDGSLDTASKNRFQPHFGDLSEVRIHTDTAAAATAHDLGARAVTIGNDISFASGRYAPESAEGQRLLAHELAHVKSPMARSGVVHRDLAGYTSEHTDVDTSSIGPEGGSVILDVTSADASAIASALSALRSAGKIGSATRGDLQRFWATGATQAEVEAAFTAAGFPKAHDMAVSLLDGTRIAIYSHNDKVYIPGLIWDTTISDTSQNVSVQTKRGLTNAERTAAQEVFGNSLNYDSIVLEEDAVMSIGGFARTTPWTINFPVGTLSGGMDLPWLLHEMGHTWEYAHGVSMATTLYHAIRGVYYYGGEPELARRTASGQGLASFNTEQQADIAKDAYAALHGVGTVAVFLAYINEFHTGYR
jgi:hypothetical protein